MIKDEEFKNNCAIDDLDTQIEDKCMKIDKVKLLVSTK